MELRRRALEGVQQPMVYKGEIVGRITRKTDTVLMFAIKNQRERRTDPAPTRNLSAFASLVGPCKVPSWWVGWWQHPSR